MRNFQVKYQNGTTPDVHQATLTCTPGYWDIQFAAPDGFFRSAQWRVSDIVTEQAFTNSSIFHYGINPRQTIECTDDSLPGYLRATYPDKFFFKKRRGGPLLAGSLALIALLALIGGALIAAYFLLLPYAAGKVAAQIPQSMEVKLGDALYNQMLADYQIDDSLTENINAFARAIDFGTNYPIRITVVRQEELNAFALPGGHIVVFDGILKKMKTKEELAALLAHEVSHVHYRHTLRGIFRSMGGYLFILLILNDISGMAAIVAENSSKLLNLTYSRALETEADHKAAEIFQRQGISLKGFVDLFKLLQSGEAGGPAANLFSTHPLTEDRLRYAVAIAREQTQLRDQSELQRQWLKIRKTR